LRAGRRDPARSMCDTTRLCGEPGSTGGQDGGHRGVVAEPQVTGGVVVGAGADAPGGGGEGVVEAVAVAGAPVPGVVEQVGVQVPERVGEAVGGEGAVEVVLPGPEDPVVGAVAGKATRSSGLVTLCGLTGLAAGALMMLSPTPAGYDELADVDRLGGNLMAAAGPLLAAMMFIASFGLLTLAIALSERDA